jgi:hypothetical protein
MSALSSSTRRNRQYKKISNHFKNNSRKIGNETLKNGESFWNVAFNCTAKSKTLKPKNGFGSTKKGTLDSWYK